MIQLNSHAYEHGWTGRQLRCLCACLYPHTPNSATVLLQYWGVIIGSTNIFPLDLSYCLTLSQISWTYHVSIEQGLHVAIYQANDHTTARVLGRDACVGWENEKVSWWKLGTRKRLSWVTHSKKGWSTNQASLTVTHSHIIWDRPVNAE